MSNRRHKDFGSGKTLNDFEPISFTLAGQEFQCKPAVQGKTLLVFVAQAAGDDGGVAAQALYSIFERIMPEEEYERFMKLLDSDDNIFDMEEIGSIASWLVEQYTARPTQQSSPSANGQSPSGQTSMVVPSVTV